MATAGVIAGREQWCIDEGDALVRLRLLPDGCVHCCATSPPYFGLRDYGVAGQIGLEETPALYCARLVEVFREVWRVLRDDGVFWLNVGDSYSSGGREGHGNVTSTKQRTNNASASVPRPPMGDGVKPKDLLGIPWMLAFALRDDGWYLRADVPWVKRNCMPESVTDRPSKALEYVFLLTKKPRYFFDAEAVRRESSEASGWAKQRAKGVDTWKYNDTPERLAATGQDVAASTLGSAGSRNLRNADLWFQSVDTPHGLVFAGEEMVGLDVTTVSFKGAHFAVWPPALVEPMICAGTSAHGCCAACGAPWLRVVERDRKPTRPGVDTKCLAKSDGDAQTAETMGWNRPQVIGNRDPQRHCTVTATVGWEPSCECGTGEVLPCLILDPFAGSGTTVMVARRLGRRAIGVELNPEYAAMARRRVAEDNPMFNAPAPERPADEVGLFDSLDAPAAGREE